MINLLEGASRVVGERSEDPTAVHDDADDAAGGNAPAEVGEDPEYSGSVVAEILGITERRLNQLVVEGMPKSSRGKFPLKGCVQWYVAYWRDRAQGRKDDTLRTRKSVAEALLLEAKVKMQSGELIDRAEAVQAWSGTFARLARSFESLPNKLAREFNWAPEVVRAFRAALDDFRVSFVRDSGEFVDAVVSDDEGHPG